MKSLNPKWQIFYKELDKYILSDLREGQTLMLSLFCVDKDLYDSIVSTENDCFYNDKNIENFQKTLIEHWGEIKGASINTTTNNINS